VGSETVCLAEIYEALKRCNYGKYELCLCFIKNDVCFNLLPVIWLKSRFKKTAGVKRNKDCLMTEGVDYCRDI